MAFAGIFTSPLQRAVRTCELAGFGSAATVDPDLVEWHYGDYEGRTTAEIRAERPDWQLFREAAPVGSRRSRSVSGPIGSCGGCKRLVEMSCCFPVGTFSGCSPRAGSDCHRGRVSISCWVPRASASWAMSMTLPEPVILLWTRLPPVAGSAGASMRQKETVSRRLQARQF